MPPINPAGELVFGLNDWYALSVSVAGDAVGRGGSMVEMRREGQTPRNPGGDVFTYYSVGSHRIHEDYVDTVRLEQSREQMQLGQVAVTPSGDREISNLDYGMGVISVNPNTPTGSMFPTRVRFYFTLTKAWAEYMRVTHSSYQIGNAQPNARTIYSMTWIPGTPPSWSQPSIALTPTDLFGPFTLVDPSRIEIDALSVDSTMANLRVVFSLTPDSDYALHSGSFDQILVYQSGQSPAFATTSLKTHPPGGAVTTFSNHLGLKSRIDGTPDNVTAVCAIDPKELYQIGQAVGIATDQLACRQGLLGISASRQDDPAVAEYVLHLQVTGLGLGGYDLGLVQLFTEGEAVDPGSGVDPGDAVPWGAPFVIDPVAAGHNVFQLSIPIPSGLDGVTFRCSAQYWGVKLDPAGADYLRESAVLSVKL
jgi:hypothetical protein